MLQYKNVATIGRVTKIKNLRWYMIGLVMVGVIFNYLARNTLAVAAPTMMAEMGISIKEYSYIDATFKACYTLMQPVAGFLLDFLGTKAGLAIFAIAWAAINMCHAFAGNWQTLAVLRGGLGAAEAAVIPAGVKASSEWFPAKERASAVGWFNVGSSVGGMVAPPLVAWAILVHSWQVAFLITGAFSLFWVVAWIKFYKQPKDHPNLSDEEREYIVSGQETQHRAEHTQRASVAQILGNRQFWGIALPRFLAEPAWGTFNAWIPLFMYKVYGFDLKHMALFLWLPMLFADFGCVIGGYMPAFFQKRFGVDLIVSRKLVVTLGALLMIAPGLIGLFSSPYVAIGVLCIGAFAHQSLSGALITLGSDVFGKNEVATATGMAGMAAWTASTLFTLVVGALAETLGFAPLFAMLAAFDLVGMIVIWSVLQNRQAVFKHATEQ